MHVSGFHFDLYYFIQVIFTVFAVSIGLLRLLKKAASKYFIVDANFDDVSPTGGSQMIPVDTVDDSCAVCGNSGGRKCSRCKSVRYCSAFCQSKDWKESHRFKCKAVTICKEKASIDGNKSCTQIQQLKKVLFPYEEFVELFNCEKQGFPPCGLLNCGNSCFANVVLQCLSCTRPLIAYLLERGHRRECRRNDWCFLCELEVHVERARLLQPFSPINILSRLPNIGGNLGYGKQEDAHEFMRFAIDTMQSGCLDEFGGEKALHPFSQGTTLVQYTFGGHLQSQVTCIKCNKISYRYENMMDLTVEIQGDAASLEDCLDRFTAEEWLDGENMYKCDGCNDYVKACKRLTIHQAPNILTIALKRFQSGRYGKLNKRVTFPETFDLSRYMSRPGDGTDLYQLYAVVVHVDMLNASFFGHYICYTTDFHGKWYRVDDCKVITVELEEVLAQGAYMLLYSRTCVRPSCANPLENSGKEDWHLGEVVKEAQPCLPEPEESIAIERSTNSVAVERMASDVGTQAEDIVSKKGNPVCKDLVDPLKFNLTFTREVDLDSRPNDPIKDEERPQDALDIDVDYQLTSSASAEVFNGVSNFVPPNEVIPSIEAHNLECEVLVTNLDDGCRFDNDNGKRDIYNKEPMSLDLSVDACLTSQSEGQEIASCSLPLKSVDKSCSQAKLKPLFAPGFLDKHSRCRAPNTNGKALVRCSEVGGSSEVSNNCNGFAHPGVFCQNINELNDRNGRFKSDAVLKFNSFDKQSEMSQNREPGGPCSVGSHVPEIASPAKLLHEILSSDMECTTGGVNGAFNSCNKEVNMVSYNPYRHSCEIDGTFSRAPVAASSSDREMLDELNLVNDNNERFNSDSIPNPSSFDKRSEDGDMNNEEPGDGACSVSSNVSEIASPANLLLEVPSSDRGHTSGGGNGAWNSCYKVVLLPESNSVTFCRNQCCQTYRSAPVAASSSDIEMLDEPNFVNDTNGTLNSDTMQNSSSFDKQSVKGQNGVEKNNGELGDGSYSASSDVAEMSSPAKLLAEVMSFNMECTFRGENGVCVSCNDEVMLPELNTVSCEIAQTSLSCVDASSSDVEMLDDPSLASSQSRQQLGLEHVASVESGKGYPAAESGGSMSCSRVKLNPLLFPGFLDRHTKQKPQNRNGNSQTVSGEFIPLSGVSHSNGFGNDDFHHQSNNVGHVGDEHMVCNGLTESSRLIEGQCKMNVSLDANGKTGRELGDGGNAQISYCNRNGKPVVGYENNTTCNNGPAQVTVGKNLKGVFSRGFLDKRSRQKPLNKDEEGRAVSENGSSKHDRNKLPRFG